MKIIVSSLIALALLLAACAPSEERAKTKALYEKYNGHCMEHARTMAGEKDEESSYRECMDYFVGTDVHCPYCVADPHMEKK